MSISINWENDEKRLLVSEFTDEWTWNDFHAAVRQMHDMIRAVDHTVDMLLIHKVDLPSGNPMVHFNNATRNQPDNTGKVIVVNPRLTPALKMFLRTLATVLERIFPNKSTVAIVTSLDEARTLLAKHDRV